MGLTSSTATDVKEEVVRQVHCFRELAFLTYDDFLKQIEEINKITKTIPDSQGKILIFAVKKGTDTTVLWKNAIRIACIRVDEETGKLDSFRLLNLKQFLKAYNSLSSCASAKQVSHIEMSTSMIFDGLDSLTSDSDLECCICMERKPEVSLPCAHSYCLFCIEQWNVSHKTCPVCRDKLESTIDSWVISEAPDMAEVEEELKKAVSSLTESGQKCT